VGVFSQLGLMSAEIILGPEIDKTIWVGNLRDDWPL